MYVEMATGDAPLGTAQVVLLPNPYFQHKLFIFSTFAHGY